MAEIEDFLVDIHGIFISRRGTSLIKPKTTCDVVLGILDELDVFIRWCPILPASCSTKLGSANPPGRLAQLNPAALAVGVKRKETGKVPRALFVLTASALHAPEGHSLTWLQVVKVLLVSGLPQDGSLDGL